MDDEWEIRHGALCVRYSDFGGESGACHSEWARGRWTHYFRTIDTRPAVG